MSPDENRPPTSFTGAIALIGQVGLLISGATVLGLLAGQWVDRRIAGNGILTVLGLGLGLACGIGLALGRLMRESRWTP